MGCADEHAAGNLLEKGLKLAQLSTVGYTRIKKTALRRFSNLEQVSGTTPLARTTTLQIRQLVWTGWQRVEMTNPAL